ncbi:chorismate synthase, partial [Listeria monocytogenes]|nr:chorismate synthase [Listeria monocytogenes]
DKRASLKSAIDTAYRKYLEYKALAIKEEKAEQAKKEKEKKEREERLKNG